MIANLSSDIGSRRSFLRALLELENGQKWVMKAANSHMFFIIGEFMASDDEFMLRAASSPLKRHNFADYCRRKSLPITNPFGKLLLLERHVRWRGAFSISPNGGWSTMM
jgi:hypothetical protein